MNRWRNGIHIQCVECGRDLYWAPPEFVDRHPMPRCVDCARRNRQAIYGTTAIESVPAAPVQRRRWWWFR